MSYVICEQQRHRSACASVQSDQRLCCSLLRPYNISRFYSRNFKTLASFCGCKGRFESTLVANPEDRFSWRGSFDFRRVHADCVTFSYATPKDITKCPLWQTKRHVRRKVWDNTCLYPMTFLLLILLVSNDIIITTLIIDRKIFWSLRNK